MEHGERVGGKWWKGAAAVAAVCFVGCADTTVRPQPQAVFAVFDPGGMPPQIPLPNDLTMMPAPANAPAVAQFSGPLDPATISAQSVLVLDATAMAPIAGARPAFDAATNRLVIAPPDTGWPVGHRIAIALRGSPGGLAGTGGVPVVATPTFFFVRGANPVSNCTAPAADCASATPVLSTEQAIALERLRQAFAPLVTTLAAIGVPRDQLALAWTFTVSPAGARIDGGAGPDGGDGGGMDGGQ